MVKNLFAIVGVVVALALFAYSSIKNKLKTKVEGVTFDSKKGIPRVYVKVNVNNQGIVPVYANNVKAILADQKGNEIESFNDVDVRVNPKSEKDYRFGFKIDKDIIPLGGSVIDMYTKQTLEDAEMEKFTVKVQFTILGKEFETDEQKLG